MSKKIKGFALIGAVAASLVAVDLFVFDDEKASSSFSLEKTKTDATHFGGKTGSATKIAQDLKAKEVEAQLLRTGGGAALGPTARPPLPSMGLDDLLPKGIGFNRLAEIPEKSDQLIVKFKPESQFGKTLKNGKDKLEEMLSGLTSSDVRVSRTGQGYAVLKIKFKDTSKGGKDSEFAKISKSISTISGVEGFEEDLKLMPTYEVNDDRYGEQWYLNKVLRGGSNASLAWNKTLGEVVGGNRLTIAVIDTGVTAHPDLDANVVQGFDFISDGDRAADGNGWDSDPSDAGDGISAGESGLQGGLFEGCSVRNSSWHGTHVSGIAAAVGNNGTGIVGVAPRAQILPVRAIGKCGGYMTDIAEGIRWAAGVPVDGAPVNANPAKVINLSLGGRGACSSFMQAAITEATRAGAVVVAAAGNAGMDAREFAPANCSGVVTVGAVGQGGERAYYSNYGSKVSISAPGGDVREGATILSTLNSGSMGPGGSTYGFYQGTSMAAPVVSGAIALAMGANPKLGGASAVSLLTKTAQKFSAETDCAKAKNCGVGIVDIGAAIGIAESNVPDVALTRFNTSIPILVPNVSFEALVTLVNAGSLPTSQGNSGKVEILLSTVTGENKIKIGEVDLGDIGVMQSKGSKIVKVTGLKIGSQSAFSQLQPGEYGISANFVSGDWDANKANNFSRILPIEYVMPTMTLKKKMVNNQVPADIYFEASFNDYRVARVAMGRDWVYEWKFSNGKIVKAEGQKATLQATEVGAGNATLSLKHAESGFATESSVGWEAIAALPSVITFTEKSSNEFLREPVTMRFTPQITIGHPNDRLSAINWDINNGEITSKKTYATVTFGAGEHNIKATASTKMGYSAEFNKTIVVKANVPPVCRIDYSKPAGQTYIGFNATCSDEDGVIKGVRWMINERVTSTPMRTPYFLKVLPPKGSGNLTVKVMVADDAKAFGEAQVTVAY